MHGFPVAPFERLEVGRVREADRGVDRVAHGLQLACFLFRLVHAVEGGRGRNARAVIVQPPETVLGIEKFGLVRNRVERLLVFLKYHFSV